jgi:predicted alpha/beta superfamily hydrolase
MKMIRLILLLNAFYFSIADVVNGQAQEISQPVSIPDTEMRTFYSKILGQNMLLFIKLPSKYYIDSLKSYPSWYFTDGNRSFPLIANISSFLDIPVPSGPELVIVSIAYVIRDMADWGAWRTRDLTPTNIPSLDSDWSNSLKDMTGREYEVRSGGANRFLEFIKEEVIPFVETNYRVLKSGRGLGGYSYGGLFSLYVLFSQPELFSIYYAGSPSIDYDNRILFNLEKEYSVSHKDLKARLFMSAGDKENSSMVNNMEDMASTLESRKYPGLSVTTCVFQDETHQSCIPVSIMRAFRILY